MEIDLTKGTVDIVDFSTYKMPSSFMKISASKAYFSLMSNSSYRWQDIALSLRASVQRKPDMLNAFVNIFLFQTQVISGLDLQLH